MFYRELQQIGKPDVFIRRDRAAFEDPLSSDYWVHRSEENIQNDASDPFHLSSIHNSTGTSAPSTNQTYFGQSVLGSSLGYHENSSTARFTTPSTRRPAATPSASDKSIAKTTNTGSKKSMLVVGAKKVTKVVGDGTSKKNSGTAPTRVGKKCQALPTSKSYSNGNK